MTIFLDTLKQWSNNLITIFIFVGLLTSCSSKKQDSKDKDEEVMKKVKYAWNLLEQARSSEEVDSEIPLGFQVNRTEKEFQKVLRKLDKCNEEKNLPCIVTDFFGWKQEIRISTFHYWKDSNTETDIISSICFLFDELRYQPNFQIKQLLNSINTLFDDTWQIADFQLDTETEKLSNYVKYWIRNNIVAEFEVKSPLVKLTFHNAPKSYDFDEKHFFDKIEEYYTIKERVREILKEKANKPKIENSPWDASVYQVKVYLKKTLKDPKSYEGIEWSNVIEEGDYYFVRHKYRAKNSFGGYVIENCVFQLNDDGEVIGVEMIE